MNIIPEDTHEPVFNAAQHSLSDVSHVLPVGLDIGLVYQDLVVNFTDLDAESTPVLTTGMDETCSPFEDILSFVMTHNHTTVHNSL